MRGSRWGLVTRSVAVGLAATMVPLATHAAGVIDKSNTNLVTWVNPDRGVTKAGGLISRWLDQSGYANHLSQAIVSGQPLFTNVMTAAGLRSGAHNDGNGAIRLDGATALTGIVFEIWCVIRPTTFSPLSGWINVCGTRNGTSGGWGLELGNTSNLQHLRVHNGAQIDVQVSATLTASNTYMLGGIIDGAQVQPRVLAMTGQWTSNSAAVAMVASPNSLRMGNRDGGGGTLAGEWFDTIIFNRILTPIERTMVEHYVLCKYSTNTWSTQHYTGQQAAKGGYASDVFGVGRVDASNQLLTNTMVGLTIEATGGTLGDNEWVMAGTLGGDNYRSISDLPAGVSQRWQRVWYVEKTGVDAKLTFAFGDAGISAPAGSPTVYLMYSSAQAPLTFSTLGITPTVNGDAYTFAVPNATLASGYYTIGTTEAIPTAPPLITKALGPGGLYTNNIASNLLVWARADMVNGRDTNGVPYALPAVNSTVSTWKDLSAYGNHLSAVIAGSPPVFTNKTMEAGARFGVLYDGIGNHGSQTPGGFTGSVFTAYAVVHATNYSIPSAYNLGGTRDATSGWDWDMASGPPNANLYLRIVTNSSPVGYQQPYILTIANNLSYVLKAVMDGTAGQVFLTTAAGTISSNGPPLPGAMVPSTSTYVIGGIPHAGGGVGWPGHVFETIVLNRTLSASEQILVDNYLNSLYMTNTLAIGDYYTGDTPANGDYDYDVFGIFKIDSSTVVLTGGSAGFGIAEHGIGATLEAGDSVFAGHKTPTNSLVLLSPKPKQYIWQRSWYVDVAGDVECLLTFDSAGSGVQFLTGQHKLAYRAGEGDLWTQLSLPASYSGERISFAVPASLVKKGYYTLLIQPSVGSTVLIR